MITLAEAQERVTKLWGKQAPKTEEIYRLMKYVLRVEHEGHTALHNVMTGQLILLNEDEIRLLDTLPATYSADMAALVADHYLVPQGYNEYKQLQSLRTILRKLTPPAKAITHYTILPTTACNARCYYCFEQGVETITMTEQVANDTVEYIAAHCGEAKKVSLRWFGGEPTVAPHRIDQICKGLEAKGISYHSQITTNGYLLDDKMVRKAVDLWHVKHVMISVDGVEENYNRIKNYVKPQDDPYQRVMRNIGLLLDEGVQVGLRMNFDVNNYLDFEKLVNDAKARFGQHPNLEVYVHPVNGEYPTADGTVQHGSEEWFREKVVELNDIARNAGMQRWKQELPRLRFGCQATGDSAKTITADGHLARCGEQIRCDDATGTLTEGETNAALVSEWKVFGDFERCGDCVYFPYCNAPKKCRAGGLCTYKSEYLYQHQRIIWQKVANNRKKGDD